MSSLPALAAKFNPSLIGHTDYKGLVTIDIAKWTQSYESIARLAQLETQAVI